MRAQEGASRRRPETPLTTTHDAAGAACAGPAAPGQQAAEADARARILAALTRAPRPALFVTELAVRVGDGNGESFAMALAGLRGEGQVLVTEHPAPDRHLAGSDLRIVAGPVPAVGRAGAEEAAEALWREWVTEFAAGHRCG